MEKVKCIICGETAFSEKYPFCPDHIVQGMGYRGAWEKVGFNDCPNCSDCPAFVPDRGQDIPQAGRNTCPVCGKTGWLVANRCPACREEGLHTCPTFAEPVWAPGLHLLRL